jgi:hypothetical protein
VIDEVGPHQQITDSRTPKRVKAQVSSTAKMVIALGLTAAAASVFIESINYTSAPTAVIEVVRTPIMRKPAGSVSLAAPEADTQYGQSTAKLARLFSAFFGPAPADESSDDGYSFG